MGHDAVEKPPRRLPECHTVGLGSPFAKLAASFQQPWLTPWAEAMGHVRTFRVDSAVWLMIADLARVEVRPRSV